MVEINSVSRSNSNINFIPLFSAQQLHQRVKEVSMRYGSANKRPYLYPQLSPFPRDLSLVAEEVLETLRCTAQIYYAN